jgi:hypothetical protein
MAVTCDKCGAEATSYTMRFRAGRIQHECHVCEHPPISDARCANPYSEMVIDHVTGDDGKPLRITSSRQLREAEKKYHFRSLVGHTDEANFDRPPQRKQESIAEAMTRTNKWMYPDVAIPMMKEMKARGELD